MIESTQDYYNKDSFAKKLRRLKEEVYFHSHDVCNLFTCVSKGVSFHTHDECNLFSCISHAER